MNVNLELYKIFFCVVKHGSITGAAKELFISQPAVSQSIKQLEHQLGGNLFHRTPRGMELTQEGRAILEYVERANGLIEQAEIKFNQMKNLVEGTISIGASDNICRNFLLPYICEYKKKFPGINLRFINGTSSQTISLLKSGKVDIGFINLPVSDDDIAAEPCGQLHDCFVAGSKYAELAERAITLEELLQHPMILLSKGTTSRRAIDEYFKSFGVSCEPDIEVGSHDLLIAFAKNNMGISCVTEEFVAKELNKGSLYKLKLKGDIRSRNIGYIRLKHVTPTFAAQKLVSMILPEKEQS